MYIYIYILYTSQKEYLCIFYGGNPCDSQIVFAGAVPGLLQSAYRAELFAILKSLEYAQHWGRSIRLWSDCQSVVDRCRRLIAFREPPKINSPHVDLWLEIFYSLQACGNRSVEITKVAAHQDNAMPDGALEQWAFAHNGLADRVARLANLQRSENFWAMHRQHAAAVDFARFVSGKVQSIILKGSRQVVNRERLRDEIGMDIVEPEHQRPRMSLQVPPWPGFEMKTPLPITSMAKFGHRLVAVLTSWFAMGINEGLATEAPVQWVSLYQLYLDFQMQTGELGPINQKARWIDPYNLPQLRLKPASFKKRTAWFGRVFRWILSDQGCKLASAVTRPASISLALHANSVAVPWSLWRLEAIEVWLSQQLHRAATRDGSSLQSLPPAKQDRRWPHLHLEAGPFRP